MKNNSFIFYLNGLKWNVVQVEYAEDIRLAVDDSYHFGSCNFNETTIYLWSGCNQRILKKILIHELTHAAILSYGLHANVCFGHEELCEFVAFHSERILKIADDYMKEINYANA